VVEQISSQQFERMSSANLVASATLRLLSGPAIAFGAPSSFAQSSEKPDWSVAAFRRFHAASLEQ